MGIHQDLTFDRITFAPLLLLVLLLAATFAEARVLTRINRRSLFDVSAACKVTAHPMLCEALPPSASMKALAELAITAASDKAKEAAALTEKLMAGSGSDQILADCLSTCEDMFSSVVDSLQTADGILKGTAEPGHDFMTELSAAVTYVETCSDAFAERPELASPVAHIRDILAKLVGNSLRLGDQLKI